MVNAPLGRSKFPNGLVTVKDPAPEPDYFSKEI